MPRPELVLFTPLTPEQVAAKLAEVVAGGPFSQFSGKPLEGRVSARQLALFRVVPYRNSFKPGLYARLETATVGGRSGTMIRGRFSPSRFTQIFMLLWCGFVLFSGFPLLQALLTGGDTWPFASQLMLPLMLLFAVLLWFFGAWVGRNDPDFIRRQLIQQLGASEISQPAMR